MPKSSPLVEPVEAAANTHIIDVQMFGVAKFGGVYLLDDEVRTIIETGTSNDYHRVLEALKELRIDPSTVKNVIVTHIHLDHAGGAGFLLEHFPEARVFVHERGLPHLADPTRLLGSAAMALGETFQQYGTLRPIPHERLVPLKGGEFIDLGGRELETVYTPGHARHHVSILDRSSRCVFAGDSAGIYFPDDERFIPTTPYPEFDLPQAIQAMKTMAKLNPRAILYTHFGTRDDARRALEEQQEEYAEWGRRARKLQGVGLEMATRSIYDECYAGVEGFPRPFVERIIATNLRGFSRYFERMMGNAPQRG